MAGCIGTDLAPELTSAMGRKQTSASAVRRAKWTLYSRGSLTGKVLPLEHKAVLRLRSIQVLRAVAVVAVVACHAFGTGRGSSGVDLFFVISGLIIARVSSNATPSQFATSRFLRVFPIYWLAVTPYIAFQYADADLATLLATITLWPVWLGAYREPMLPVAWSLYFEIMFYSAAALWLFNRKLAAAGAILVVSVALFHPTAATEFILSPIVLEFGGGIALSKLERFPMSVPALAVGLTALFLPSRAFEGNTMLIAGEAIHRLVTYGAGAGLTVYGALGLEHHAAHRSASWLVRIGDASYSIYLTHLIVLRSLLGWSPSVRALLAVIVGLIVYASIERPTARFFRASSAKRADPRRPELVPKRVDHRLPTNACARLRGPQGVEG